MSVTFTERKNLNLNNKPFGVFECLLPALDANSPQRCTFTVGEFVLDGVGCKDQESMHSSTAPDPGYQWENIKLTVRHHKREPRGQPFPYR